MRQAWTLLVLGIAVLGCGDDGSNPPSSNPGHQTSVPFNPSGLFVAERLAG
jgi:hypothetical protein